MATGGGLAGYRGNGVDVRKTGKSMSRRVEAAGGAIESANQYVLEVKSRWSAFAQRKRKREGRRKVER